MKIRVYLFFSFIECKMREKIKTGISIFIILVLFPYVAVVFRTGDMGGSGAESELPVLEQCVAEILPSQMPVTYEEEALKAGATVIRTNLLRKAVVYYKAETVQEAAELLTEADLEAMGFTAYRETDLEELWNYENRQLYTEKCREAAGATEGLVLMENDELKDVPYHAVSAGATRDGRTLGEDYGYLESVDCKEDVEAADYLKISLFPDMALPVVRSRDSAGYVEEVELDGKILSGETFRFRYELNSSCFTAEKTKEGVRIVTKGLGHGFGMSLYAANRMALEGRTYGEILAYFYKNLDCISFSENGYARVSSKNSGKL